jgi:putative ABC transport system substrate-binding protein
MAITLARRRVISLLGGGVAAWALPARAQQPREGTRRLGVLILGSENDAIQKSWAAALQNGLETLGWVDRQNLRIDLRFASDPGGIQAAAKDIVGLSPDVVLVHSSPVTGAVLQQTKSIPIVFVAVGDPVANRFVDDIARPEGNVTGITNLFPSIGGKWLQLLKEAAPRTERVALLFNPKLFFSESYFASIEATATSLGVQTKRTPYLDSTELIREVDAMAAIPNGALILLPPFGVYPKPFISRLEQYRLPSISNLKSFAIAGGLMSYGADNSDLFRRAASYVDRILRGEKPRDLPVQFPTKFEMALNLKAAKALNLTVPPTLRALATDVIE